MPDDLEFSDDPARLDRDRIHSWLSEESYWAMGRDRARQDAAIDASRNFGVYDATTGEQLGYARVVTDGATFAWLCDVFVASGARGRGIGIALVDGVVAALEPLGLTRIMLATGDAHGLYAKFGFRPLARPEQVMERRGAPAPDERQAAERADASAMSRP
ncbi:GNAT family N-acetyltransferase [Agromyces bauzanensis]